MASGALRKLTVCRNKSRFALNPLLCASSLKISCKSFTTSHCTSESIQSDPKLAFEGVPEENNVIRSPYEEVQIPNISIPECIFGSFNSWHNKVAFICSVTKRQYTYEEIRLKSRNLAKSMMQKLKLQKGDVAAILLPNVPEIPIILLAGYQSGIILTTINPLYTPDEISRQFIDSDAKAIFTLNPLVDTAIKSVKLYGKNIPIISIKTDASQSLGNNIINFNELANEEYDKTDLEFPNPDHIAIMPYSSGTTGLPKGVELTHRNLVSNLKQISCFDFHQRTTEHFQEVVPAVLPMFHIYGHTNLTLYTMLNGLKVVTLPKFTPELYTSVLDEYRPGLLFIVPPIVSFMTSHPIMKDKYFESIETVFCGAAPLGSLDETKFLQRAKKDVNILQGYGLTETSPVAASIMIERKKKFNVMGSVGDPIPNTLFKIVAPGDFSGKLLQPYEKGELLVKGPQVMKGYHNKPEQTAETKVGNWLRTGDLAYYDKNNFIFVTDRLKELIKVKGFQVAPAELEELIRDHPEVNDVAIIGIPHNIYGEVPRAYIVPKKDGNIDQNSLNEYLSSRVTDYKLIRGGVALVENIPKNSAGKILRKDLKKQYLEEHKLN